jgi:adenylate cyclase
MRINYQTSQESYSYVSFADVLDNNYRQGTFGNKIVMIGSSSKKLNDLKKIPGNRYIPGVEVHAAALSTILNERFIKVLPGYVIFIITVLSGIFARFVFSLFHPVKVGLPFAIGIPILLYLAAMYSYIYRLQLVNIIIPISVTLALYAITVIQYYFRIRRTTET